jgi:hypothetical protein
MNLKKFFAVLAVAVSMASAAGADTIVIEFQGGNHPLLPAYVFQCKAVAQEKIEQQAKAFGVTVDMKTLRLTDFNSNIAARYLWWSVDVTDIKGRTDVFPAGKAAVLTKLTQQPSLGPCF